MANTKILYLEAAKREFYNNFMEHNNQYFYRGSDGKVDHLRRPHPDPPWYYHKTSILQNCHFWHRVLFDVLHQQQKVPIFCQKHCWKVVVEPRDLRELFWCFFLQREMDYASKCGSEGDRKNSSKLYGAYWYNYTLEEGLERFEQVKKHIEERKTRQGEILGCPVKVKPMTGNEAQARGLPPTMPIILKRACTEFEQHCGPSSQWKWDEEQEEKERYAYDAWVPDMESFKQNQYQLATLFMKWIHKAYQWGDPSHLMFTNNNFLFMPCETFHDRPGFVPFTGDYTQKEVEENGKTS